MSKNGIGGIKMSKQVWKIIQYYNDSDRVIKVRFCDTERGYKSALKAVRSSKVFTYKVFRTDVDWEEV